MEPFLREREVQMSEMIAVEEWEEFVRCLHLGLRLRSGAQMRNVCTAEILDLKVEDIVSCFLPQDFAAHVSGTAGVLYPDVMELIRDRKALLLFCELRRLSGNGRLPLGTRRQNTHLKELLFKIAQCGLDGAEFYRKVALILERAANDPSLRSEMYIPRSQQQSRAELLQLAS
ncbi:MAG: hypothetical protein WCW31_05615 [Patescibacteria group bacterium]|jgi:hypothetical protein